MSGLMASGLRPAGVQPAYGGRMAPRSLASARCASGEGSLALTFLAAPAALALAFVLAAPQAVAGTFVPPPGCTGYVTVQSKGCKLSNHFRCAGDPPGHQWRVDFGASGPNFASRIDAEAQWVQSIELTTGTTRALAPDPADPQSMTELLDRGIDTFDFRLESAAGETIVRGFDELTGRTVTIDGVALLETAFDYSETNPDGSLVQRARGNEYVHPEWRIFLAGPSEADVGEGFFPLDHSPVVFVFPGEPGFFSDTPQFGCDDQMSRAPATIIPAKE